MTLAIAVGLFIVWYFGLFAAKEMYADAKSRREDRIMASYLRQEDTRWHAQRLADIDRTAQATVDEMIRVAAEPDAEVVEGHSVEIERR
jgi:chloramphenicol 3-O-phosphotransferase